MERRITKKEIWERKTVLLLRSNGFMSPEKIAEETDIPLQRVKLYLGKPDAKNFNPKIEL